MRLRKHDCPEANLQALRRLICLRSRMNIAVRGSCPVEICQSRVGKAQRAHAVLRKSSLCIQRGHAAPFVKLRACFAQRVSTKTGTRRIDSIQNHHQLHAPRCTGSDCDLRAPHAKRFSDQRQQFRIRFATDRHRFELRQPDAVVSLNECACARIGLDFDLQGFQARPFKALHRQAAGVQAPDAVK
jgi:hypothetical protein